MSSKPDDGLRAIFKQHLEQRGFHMQSIETGGTGAGIPDTNGCRDGVDFWIEYKATAHWSVTLKPEQVGWIERRIRVGGRVLIAVRRRHEGGVRLGPAVDELYLFSGEHARTAKTAGLRQLIEQDRLLGTWIGGPSRWDWDRVANLLVD